MRHHSATPQIRPRCGTTYLPDGAKAKDCFLYQPILNHTSWQIPHSPFAARRKIRADKSRWDNRNELPSRPTGANNGGCLESLSGINPDRWEVEGDACVVGSQLLLPQAQSVRTDSSTGTSGRPLS